MCFFDPLFRSTCCSILCSFPTCCSWNLRCMLLLRDVTGEALFSSAFAWLCIEIESIVMLLVLRCYGFYEVLDSPRWFVSADVKARVQRLPGRPCASWKAMKGEKQGEEREEEWRLFLNCQILDSPTGGCSNQSVRVGRSPASHGFRGHAYVI